MLKGEANEAKEKVLQGRPDKPAQNNLSKNGAATFDKEFFTSLDRWRTLLATDLFKNNTAINEDELNFTVQLTIDGLLFLRMLEDRGVEPFGRLKERIGKGTLSNNIYKHLLEAGRKYNAGLFNFPKDKISRKPVIGNDVLKAIISQLYYPECPFEFSILPAEILGDAYEQFLSKRIKIDSSHKVKIEDKPGVKKAGGVYYTPQYIVEYIIKQTIGKLVEGKKPGDISRIKIVDPSCGSGIFLIRAYGFLLNWHKDYYTNNGREKDIDKNLVTPDGSLTVAEKKRILTNNIFGVDLDENAVEVTKLSLLLKCLESETAEILPTQKGLLKGSILPTLNDNIKGGNSLIDEDFYKTEREAEKEVKRFNWKKAFPSVFANGGFDVVLGNPPYGADLTKEVQQYFLNKYAMANTDTAALFMVQAKHILKDGGYNGYIIPKSFTHASNWQKTRRELLDDITTIVDCSKVWKEVKLEMTIYISVKNLRSTEFKSCVREGQSIVEIGRIPKSLCNDLNFIINGVSNKEMQIAEKMFRSPKRLNDFMTNKRGGMFQRSVANTGELNVVAGKQVQRYYIANGVNNRVSKKVITEGNAFIKENSILVQNIVAHIQNPHPRIQISATAVDKAVLLNTVILDTVNQLHNFSKMSTNYLLGILNSKIISWYTYHFVYANAIRTMHFDSSTTERIPFPDINLKNKIHKLEYDRIEQSVAQISSLKKESLSLTVQPEKDIIKEKIDYLQGKIDKAVCILFGLTREEIEYLQ